MDAKKKRRYTRIAEITFVHIFRWQFIFVAIASLFLLIFAKIHAHLALVGSCVILKDFQYDIFVLKISILIFL